MVVCGACGKVWGKHNFDESCARYAVQVIPETAVFDGELVKSADAVPGAEGGYALVLRLEKEKADRTPEA